MNQARINLDWAMAILDGLVLGGVQHLVVSPGSRNTPLLLAGQQHPDLQLTVGVDERSAAFFALGLSRASQRPVALIATSGSAIANWFPAVMEASHSSVPLVLLSADRPWEFQQCGANQTTDQQGFFGDYCRGFYALPAAEAQADKLERVCKLALQAVDKSLAVDAGPVQINVPFREPLVSHDVATSSVQSPVSVLEGTRLYPSRTKLLQIKNLLDDNPGVIVAGNHCGDASARKAIVRLASKLAVPVFADPLSGLRWGKDSQQVVMAHYDVFLQQESIRPKWIMRFGDMPVSSNLQTWLKGCKDAQHVVVEDRERWSDPLAHTTQMIHADPELFCEQLESLMLQQEGNMLVAFTEKEKHIENSIISGSQELPSEGEAIRVLLETLPDDSLLFSGNSLAIRYLDTYSSVMEKRIDVVGNRGISGIDGNVSTILGLAAGHKGKVVGILGDLTFFHDLNGLSMAKGLDAVFVVFNNNGGGIFEQLPQFQLADFEMFWKTPLDLDFEHAAKLFGIGFERVTPADNFSAVLDRVLSGSSSSIIEVMIDGSLSKSAHQAFMQNA